MTLAQKPHILVVDDFAPMGRIYRHFLKQMGLRDVTVASSGIEALNMLETRSYTAISSDWHMEPVTGFQLLQAVRAEKAYATIPFIMATVEARPERIKAARRAGATDYILKPFIVATLRSALANACPDIAAAMEPPMRTISARESAERFREFFAERTNRDFPPPAEERLIEAFAGPAP